MTEPMYDSGWLPEEEFRELSVGSDVSYRSIMRLSDRKVWCAPLGTPDPWDVTEVDEWAALTKPPDGPVR